MTNGIPPETPNGGYSIQEFARQHANYHVHPLPPLSPARNYSFSPEAMLAALKRNFPDRAPGRGTPYEDIMFKAGQVSVVRFIEAELNKDDSEFNQHPF